MTGPEGADPVGSLGEEAAKLLGALSEWSRDQGTGASDTAARAQAWWQEIDQHVATGGEDCTYCPVCRLIGSLRRTSPEARQHVADAAVSLAKAFAGFLETSVPEQQRGAGAVDDAGDDSAPRSADGATSEPRVQRIDLDEGPGSLPRDPQR